jgi:hypothetical protein
MGGRRASEISGDRVGGGLWSRTMVQKFIHLPEYHIIVCLFIFIVNSSSIRFYERFNRSKINSKYEKFNIISISPA